MMTFTILLITKDYLLTFKTISNEWKYNAFLLAGDKSMSEIHLNNPLRLVNLDLHKLLPKYLLKAKREDKNLKEQEIQGIIIKTN